MNQLVMFLEEHHGTQGRLYEFTRVEVIMEETGWSREDILHMATEADAAGELVATFSFKGNKWKVEAVAEDLMTRARDSKIEVPLIRYGKRQRIETLINEEALLLAKYLRNEIIYWDPRIK
jgi:hypothetical protein